MMSEIAAWYRFGLEDGREQAGNFGPWRRRLSRDFFRTMAAWPGPREERARRLGVARGLGYVSVRWYRKRETPPRSRSGVGSAPLGS